MSVFNTLAPWQQSLIRDHLKLVIEANQTINLTRIDSIDEGMLLHVEDSLAAINELNDAPDGLMGDLGSGAGYPGVPLAVASGRQTLLVDSRKKKMDTVDGILHTLELDRQINVYAGRAELLARQKPETFTALTARALSQLSVLLELASPLLQPNGVLICYKAQLDDIELSAAKTIETLVGMTLQSDRSFVLGGEYQRRILVFKKTAKPKMKLPRQEGQAQKHPLS